jgi:hypothetical protein
MIKFLLFKRYNFIDFTGQAFMVWGLTKYDDWTWIFIILPFSILTAVLESFERLNNGGKK